MDTYFVNQYEISFERYLEWSKHPKGKLAIAMKRKRLYKQIAIVICGIAVILSGVYLKSWEAILFGSTACCVLIYRFLNSNRAVKRQYNMLMKLYTAKEWHRTICFGGNIQITEFNSLMVYEYSQITSVTEDKEYYYLMIGNDIAIRVLKNGFIKGNQNEFSVFVQNYMSGQ
jgi:hypothetical protein